jgi:hypothetical protein
MPWVCRNGCHEEEGFQVCRDEYREDTITHFFNADDGSLENETANKVYVCDKSAVGVVECAACHTAVAWESELKEPE